MKKLSAFLAVSSIFFFNGCTFEDPIISEHEIAQNFCTQLKECDLLETFSYISTDNCVALIAAERSNFPKCKTQYQTLKDAMTSVNCNILKSAEEDNQYSKFWPNEYDDFQNCIATNGYTKQTDDCHSECKEDEICLDGICQKQTYKCTDDSQCLDGQSCNKLTGDCENRLPPTDFHEAWEPVDSDTYCNGTCGINENADAPNCFAMDITDINNADTFCSGCAVNCRIKYPDEPICVKEDSQFGQNYGCAMSECVDGYVFKVDGEKATCVPYTKPECSLDTDCPDNHHCIDEKCIYQEPEIQYRFVRIDDKSPLCGNKYGQPIQTPDGYCSLDDPGADIDAVVLRKPDGDVYYASEVIAYQRADIGAPYKTLEEIKAATSNRITYSALDPEKILGTPDSFDTYGDHFDGSCAYYTPPNKDTKPYVSLGGKGGYIEVKMAGMIETGDTLHVLELGECTLKYSTESDGDLAKAEEITVSIAADTGEWRILGSAKADKQNHGILEFMVPSDL